MLVDTELYILELYLAQQSTNTPATLNKINILQIAYENNTQ